MIIGFFKYKRRAFAGLMAILIPYALLIWYVAPMGSFMYCAALFAITYGLFDKQKKIKKGEKYAI